MGSIAIEWKSVALVLAASAVAGCFAPANDGPPELAETSSGSDTGSSGVASEVSVAEVGSTQGESESTLADSSSDDGSTAEPSSSSSTASTGETTGEPIGPECGDGSLDDGEECDDGNPEDADACSNACVAGFYTGTLDPCAAFGQTMCGYFEAECHPDPDQGELRSLCWWSQSPSQDACDDTPGIWTTPDSAFATESGYDFPLDGACITQLNNLDCSPADALACAEAGAALCFREIGSGGLPLDTHSLCWWDVDEAGCEPVPGIWTTADSGFGQGHPNALPPSDAAACVLQVAFL